MRAIFTLGIVFTAGFLLSCKEREFDQGSTSSANQMGNRAPANAAPYNVLQLWRQGGGNPLWQLPEALQSDRVTNGNGFPIEAQVNDVFFMNYEDYFLTSEKFKAVPSPEAQVRGNVLTYAVPNRQPLRLQFSAPNDMADTRSSAINECAKMNMRLPTAREIFDFCATGVQGYGDGFKMASYPANGRCAKPDVILWTVSVTAGNTSVPWIFVGNPHGWVAPAPGPNKYFHYRCVGLAK